LRISSRSPTCRPVADAVITVDGTARQTRSDTGGHFVLPRVPVGIKEISIRKIGYRPGRAMLDVRADSAMIIAATLVSDVQQLRGVRIEEQLLNQLGGVVLDERFRPLPGAEVDIVGLRRSMTTDEDGRFIFTDLPTGNYLLEVRSPGYSISRRGVQMVGRIERDMAIRLRAATDTRFTAELAKVVAQEADRRKSLAGARAVFVGRDELARWKDTPLLDALMEGSGALALRELNASGGRGGRSPRGVTTLGGGGGGTFTTNTMARGASVSATSCVLIDGWEVPTSPILSFLRASEVELVEIFPANAENSRTLCGRFPPSSGCSCPPEPAGIVVWLKK